jgi:deltex-like protein
MGSREDLDQERAWSGSAPVPWAQPFHRSGSFVRVFGRDREKNQKPQRAKTVLGVGAGSSRVAQGVVLLFPEGLEIDSAFIPSRTLPVWSLGAKSSEQMAAAEWLCDLDGVWSPYAPDVSASIEASFTDSSKTTLDLHLGRGSAGGAPTHVIDLESMEQQNSRTGFRRPVRRRRGASAPPIAGTCEFQNEHGKWISYNPNATEQILIATKAGRTVTTIFVEHSRRLWAYQVDLQRNEQINMHTKMRRPLRIQPAPGATGGGPGPAATAGGGPSPAASAGMGGVRLHEPPWELNFVATPADAVDLSSLTQWRVLKPGEWDAGDSDPVMMTDLGDDDEPVVRLPCHTAAVSCTFNRSTLEEAFKSSNKCPTCGTMYALPGPQPSGRMRASLDPSTDCDGHVGGTVVLDYTFPSGVQQPQHPKPGVPYDGTRRICYLPNDATGQRCVALLRAAFLQGALFRVGSSSTTGKENAVVWSIHQKTRPDGGATRHGWPDDGYLQRLQSECASANVKGALDM